jgi:hypothetical protein
MNKHTPGPYHLVITQKNADGSPHEMEIRSYAVSQNYAVWLAEQGKEKSPGTWGTVTMGKYHQMTNGSGPTSGPQILLSDEEAFANAERVLLCLSVHDELVAALEHCIKCLDVSSSRVAGGALKEARAALVKAKAK